MNSVARTDPSVQWNLTLAGVSIGPMASMIDLDNTECVLVEDLFDPPGRGGRPATYSRPAMVDAILFIARTGCPRRYLPEPA